MQFAKVDVCVYGHPKFCAADMEAVAYWLGALTYTCCHELDGHIPDDALGLILAVGIRKARRLCQLLVDTGLFERTENGYLIAKYALKNLTKEQLDAQRRETAERVATHRKSRTNHAPHRPVDASGDAPGNGDRNALPGPPEPPLHEGGVLNSLSLNLKDRERVLNARAHEPVHGSPPAPIRAPIPPDLKLTPEARSAAEMLGVQDIDGEWVKFVAHHRANGTLATDFYALWSKWAVMARNYERMDRERNAHRASSTAPRDPPPAPYHSTSKRRRPGADLEAQLMATIAEMNAKPEGEKP